MKQYIKEDKTNNPYIKLKLLKTFHRIFIKILNCFLNNSNKNLMQRSEPEAHLDKLINAYRELLLKVCTKTSKD